MVEEHTYKKAVSYIKHGLKHKPYHHLKKELLDKKWPEHVVDKAHKEALENSDEIIKILTSPVKKHSREEYIEKLATSKHQKRHFYEKFIEQENLSNIKKKIKQERDGIYQTAEKFMIPKNKASAIPIIEEDEEYLTEVPENPMPKQTKTYSYNDPFLSSKKHQIASKSVTDFDKTLENLEEQLKNINEVKKEDPEAYKNKIIPEPIEYVSEPVGDRAQTGIPGLDPVIQGGLRRNTVTLVAGGPGSGKSTFGLQYLINGTNKFGENGVYITFEQSKKDLYEVFQQNKWDLEELEKQKKMQVLRLTPEQMLKILEGGGGTLRDAVESIHARRIVIDSISDLLMLYQSEFSRRKFLIELFELMAKLKCTTLVIAEQEVDPLKHTSQVTEYQVDGVILLYNERVGDIRQRGLEIFKMRGTKHAGRIFPMKMSDEGIFIITNFKK